MDTAIKHPELQPTGEADEPLLTSGARFLFGNW